jgi:AcrR family transcriptional regulator
MDNRSVLLVRALELFAAHGYDAVGVQEIVESAGVTKPTLYHYFGSKQGLLKALLDENFDQFTPLVKQAADYHGDLTFSLNLLARTFFDFARDHPTFYRFQLSTWFAPHQSEAYTVVAVLNETLHNLVEELFRRAAFDHGNMKGRQRLYAATFTGMLNTCIGLWLNGYAELDDTLIYRAVHQFQHGIYS